MYHLTGSPFHRSKTHHLTGSPFHRSKTHHLTISLVHRYTDSISTIRIKLWLMTLRLLMVSSKGV